MNMSTRTSVGEAFVSGRCVAAVDLVEEWIADAVPVAIPGQNTVGYKDLSHAGQAYVRVTRIYDEEFETRLKRLVEFTTGDLDRKRAIRDAGQRAIALDLIIEGGRVIRGARIDPPLTTYTDVVDTAFPVALPD